MIPVVSYGYYLIEVLVCAVFYQSSFWTHQVSILSLNCLVSMSSRSFFYFLSTQLVYVAMAADAKREQNTNVASFMKTTGKTAKC